MQTDIQQVEIIDQIKISHPHTMYDSAANDFYDVYIVEIASGPGEDQANYRFALSKDLADQMFKDYVLP